MVDFWFPCYIEQRISGALSHIVDIEAKRCATWVGFQLFSSVRRSIYYDHDDVTRGFLQ